MNEYNQQVLDALQGGYTPYQKIHNIYEKNDHLQKVMRALAAKTNTAPNGIDHYYHRKTVYEAAQNGIPDGLTMMFLGSLKETKDILRDIKKLGAKKAFNESEKDLQNNINGFILGMNNELPPEQNPEFNKYNSATVNMLLPRMPKETK